MSKLRRLIFIISLLFLLGFSASASYIYDNEFMGMENILLTVDLDMDDFPDLPLTELQNYALSILRYHLREALPANTTFYLQDFPESGSVDTIISVDLLIGDNGDEDLYYGDVLLKVYRIVKLAKIETDSFWSVVYDTRYIIRGHTSKLKEQIKDTVEPMVLELVDLYKEAHEPFQYPYELEYFPLFEAHRL